jgi:hypothetical protein
MAVRRSNRFDPNIDQELLSSLEKAAAGYGPYDVELFSGYRANPSRYNSQHGPRGRGAIDLNLIDRKTGKALPNIRDPQSAPAYQQFANAWYNSLTPEQQEMARWGGYFSDIPDWMHFDFGGAQNMAGGDWKGGFNQAQASRYGVGVGGGIEAIDAQMQAAGYTPEQRRNAIASIESAGSGDYKALGVWTGDPEEGRDRAYGRYQVMGSNIAPWAQKYLGQSGVTAESFLNDPALQDKLFDAVFSDYVKRYGEGGAAQAWFAGPGSVGKGGNAADVLGTTTNEYVKRYLNALTGPPRAVHPPNPKVGSGGYVAPGADTTPVPPDKAPGAGAKAGAGGDKWAKAISGALGGIGESLAPTGSGYRPIKPLPPVQSMPQPALPMIAETMADENRRNQLAALMQQYWIT